MNDLSFQPQRLILISVIEGECGMNNHALTSITTFLSFVATFIGRLLCPSIVGDSSAAVC
jgi:hypothetical protein